MRGKVMLDDVEYNKRLVKKYYRHPTSIDSEISLKSKTPFDKEGARWSRTASEVVGFDGLKIRIKSKKKHILFRGPNELKNSRSDPI
ncbi:unnamed protein product [Phytophthora fragariaefolia]|uniref:Unnamed protein product n=1 Tax=Phytophthora fragariaefolia TaxID=1490495 RepID=A0A9W6XJW9_9STRA|nr:unnamed protein product [Phytophthora fragariaefolia]